MHNFLMILELIFLFEKNLIKNCLLSSKIKKKFYRFITDIEDASIYYGTQIHKIPLSKTMGLKTI